MAQSLSLPHTNKSKVLTNLNLIRHETILQDVNRDPTYFIIPELREVLWPRTIGRDLQSQYLQLSCSHHTHRATVSTWSCDHNPRQAPQISLLETPPTQPGSMWSSVPLILNKDPVWPSPIHHHWRQCDILHLTPLPTVTTVLATQGQPAEPGETTELFQIGTYASWLETVSYTPFLHKWNGQN